MYTKVQFNEEELNHKKIRVTDQNLKDILDWKTTKIKLSRVDTPVKVTDINQSRIGNCYMLAALGSILEKDTEYLNKILKYDVLNKTVEISLRENQEVWTYVLDATKIDSLEANDHTHAAIFLLEKAYALHRVLTGEAYAIRQQNNKNSLKEKEHDFSLNVEQVREGKIVSSFENFKIHSQSFEDALNQGHPRDVYQHLGLSADTEALAKPEDPFKKIIALRSSLNVIRSGKEDYIDMNREDLFNQNFNSVIDRFSFTLNLNDSEKESLKQNFLKLIELPKQDRESIVDEIKKHLTNLIDSPKALIVERATEFVTSLFTQELDIKSIAARLIRTIPQKRGFALYTTEQEELFKKISENLTQNKLVSVESKETIGKSSENSATTGVGEPISKGLVGKHAYHVLDSYQRDGLKFLLIRNPWGHTVRDYQWKKKQIGNQTVSFLSAHAKTNLDSKSKEKSHGLGEITNSARLLDDKKFEKEYKKNGYFEVELTDFTKRFWGLTITKNPLDIKVETNNTSKFNNFKSEYQQARKAKILEQLRQEIIEIDSPEDLDQFKQSLKDRSEFKVLKTGQGTITKIMNLKTSSVEALEDILNQKERSFDSMSPNFKK
ncbi:multifunctional virulence effector protein DrrA [Legionella gratiana]|uniref:Multifunctional virulence effector protein DrrA n=1 Tax=Legionella gratiana TaxID=45066 RepID=A0A378JAP3_9GAMM|nr:C2 family cysteine protease [Legionella gratiana]KTD10842.1 multifunctional virulence effector protein DrrA [Legionella gratiana]STX44041.1 substrate of the Dot/Icm secretion system [Legionella gratiana]